MTNEDAARIESLQILDQQLPFRFISGAEIKGLAVWCSKCGSEINEKYIRGEFSAMNQYSTALEAYGICYSVGCLTITPIRCHFDCEGGYLSQTEGGWVKGRYASEKPTGWVDKIKSFFLGVGDNHE